MGRIITKDGMARDEETVYSEEEYDEDGNYFPRPDKPIIPIEELKQVNYFQYRIDILPEGQKEPKIIIGLCRDGFRMN
jgi:hypothetical protein